MAWNVAVLLVGIGFLYQGAVWAPVPFALGYPVLVGVWSYYLLLAARFRWSERSRPSGV